MSILLKKGFQLFLEPGHLFQTCDAPYMSTIWYDGKIVGEVTSGSYGHRVGSSIALGMIVRWVFWAPRYLKSMAV